jgi:NADH-quinone oxidoreductase subunit J
MILGFGILSVTTRKIFRSAIWLLFTLIGIAGLYFWLELEFIAAVQIIVYVGGIVVLIIFSVFLTQQSGEQMAKPPLARSLSAIISVAIGFALTFLLIAKHGFVSTAQPLTWSMEMIGRQMMGTEQGGFALPFEVVSILLLAAMIGAIVIATKQKAIEK